MLPPGRRGGCPVSSALPSLAPDYPGTPAMGFYDGWSKGGSPGKMRNYIHKPIKTQGMQMSDAKELSSKVYHIIESKLKQLP